MSLNNGLLPLQIVTSEQLELVELHVGQIISWQEKTENHEYSHRTWYLVPWYPVAVPGTVIRGVLGPEGPRVRLTYY